MPNHSQEVGNLLTPLSTAAATANLAETHPILNGDRFQARNFRFRIFFIARNIVSA